MRWHSVYTALVANHYCSPLSDISWSGGRTTHLPAHKQPIICSYSNNTAEPSLTLGSHAFVAVPPVRIRPRLRGAGELGSWNGGSARPGFGVRGLVPVQKCGPGSDSIGNQGLYIGSGKLLGYLSSEEGGGRREEGGHPSGTKSHCDILSKQNEHVTMVVLKSPATPSSSYVGFYSSGGNNTIGLQQCGQGVKPPYARTQTLVLCWYGVVIFVALSCSP